MGLSQSPRQCGGRTGPEQRLVSELLIQSLSHPYVLPRRDQLFPSCDRHIGKRAMISPQPLNCTPKAVSLCYCLPPQEPHLSPDTDSHPCRGFLGLPRPWGISFSDCKAFMGVPAAQRVVSLGSSHVHVKDYVFATKGRI